MNNIANEYGVVPNNSPLVKKVNAILRFATIELEEVLNELPIKDAVHMSYVIPQWFTNDMAAYRLLRQVELRRKERSVR